MGYHLARRLSFEKRDVVLIDRNPERVAFIQDNLDVHAIHGAGSSPSSLTKAGIEKATILIAVTDSDEVNLVACFVAGHLNPYLTKVARLRDEDFSEHPEILDHEHLGVDLVINPEDEAVRKLVKVLQVPPATDVIDFAEGRIRLFGVRLGFNSPLVGRSLIDLRQDFPDDRVLIPALLRESEVLIPGGNDVLRALDTIYVVVAKDSLPRVVEHSGLGTAPLKRFMIVGGTRVAEKTARELESFPGAHVRLVCSDAARCEAIAGDLNETMVLRSDAVDEDFLRAEGIARVDAFLALTYDDEHNALSALLAKRMGARWTGALANKMEYHRLASAIGVDVVVNPRLSGASRILQYIRKGKVISVTMLPGEDVEAIEFEAVETSKLVGSPLRKVKFPQGAIIGAIERAEEFFIPHGDTVIQPGDRVIVFARREAVPKIEKLLTVKLEYFF